MKPWSITGCTDCDDTEVEIIPSAGNGLNDGVPNRFFEVKQSCVAHGSKRYVRIIEREKPELKLV